MRQLLAHTSGLADYAGDAAFLRRTVSEPRRRWKPRELVRVALAQVRSHGPASVSRTRARTTSCSASSSSARPGRPSSASCAAGFSRRSSSSTSFSPGTQFPGRHAHGYAPSQHDGIVGSLATARDRSTASASWGWAAGAIVSTAPDLSRFFGALLQGRLLPARLLALMRPREGARYGLGLAAFRTPCGTAIGHTGNLLGTVSAAWNSLDGRRRVVAMTNSYPLSPAADTAFRRLLESSFCGTYGLHDRELRAGEVAVPCELLEPQLDPARQQRRAGAERHRRDRDDHLVEQPGVGELTGQVSPADDPDVPVAGGARPSPRAPSRRRR